MDGRWLGRDKVNTLNRYAYNASPFYHFDGLGLFIFSNIMESYCDKVIEQTKVKRTILISRLESAKTKFEIANAFAHCYWNALDKTINNVDTENRLELSFITKK